MRDTESPDSLFKSVIASLTQGQLTFPPPFDLAASAALAANIDRGRIADNLFNVTAQRDTGYRVEVYATAPGVEDREVIATRVPSTALLVSLLDGLLDELCARHDASIEEGESSGG